MIEYENYLKEKCKERRNTRGFKSYDEINGYEKAIIDLVNSPIETLAPFDFVKKYGGQHRQDLRAFETSSNPETLDKMIKQSIVQELAKTLMEDDVIEIMTEDSMGYRIYTYVLRVLDSGKIPDFPVKVPEF